MGCDGTPGSGRILRLDPFALPASYVARDEGADGQMRLIELDRSHVTLHRTVHGIRMRVRAVVAEYRGVSLRTLPPEDDAPAAIAIVLEHHDAGLTVPLHIATDGNDATAQWKCWARVLGVPLLVVDSDGSLREPFRRVGRLAADTPAPRRRRRAAVRSRRPAILLRRKPGRPPATPTVYRGEREIIAQN